MKEPIRLVIPSEEYKRKITAFRNTLLNEGCKTIEGAPGLFEEEDIEKWIEDTLDYRCNDHISIFLAVRNRDERIIGIISIRNEEINDYVDDFAGNISYTIAPTTGSKSDYASLMIGLIKQKAKILQIQNLLITCDAKDVRAQKAILKNGGELKNDVFNLLNGKIVKRYWLK